MVTNAFTGDLDECVVTAYRRYEIEERFKVCFRFEPKEGVDAYRRRSRCNNQEAQPNQCSRPCEDEVQILR